MNVSSQFVCLLFVTLGVLLVIGPASSDRHDARNTDMSTNSTTHHNRKHQRQLDKASASVTGRARQPRRRGFAEINGPGCSGMKCEEHEVCVGKISSGRQTASCVDSKLAHLRLARGRGKRRESNENVQHMTRTPRQLADKVEQMKAQARDYETHREKNQQQRLHWAMGATAQPVVMDMQNDATDMTSSECHRRDLNAVGERLLDQFKQQQDDHNNRRKKEKRNSTKKELHEDDECICQSPVSWQFQRLDVDADGQLTDRETMTMLDDKNLNVAANCLTAFVQACDHNVDSALSEKEWCCCFADVLPPCLAALKMVPSILVRGQPSIMPGAVVPQCDDDGFYKPVQCDSHTGQCWCSDHNGHRLNGTTTDGFNC